MQKLILMQFSKMNHIRMHLYTQDIKVMLHVLRRYETYYILLHVVGVGVFHTLNVGVLGGSAGLQALEALFFVWSASP